MKETVLTIGQGEIGEPISRLIEESNKYNIYKKDMEEITVPEEVDIMSIAIPFLNQDSFVEIVSNYYLEFKPKLIIINSTVLPETCQKIHKKTGVEVVASPVRGLHRKDDPNRMYQDIKWYSKYIGGSSIAALDKAEKFFNNIGLKTTRVSNLEAAELLKPLNTSYFGLLIAWAQEVERFCEKYGADYYEVMSFAKEGNERVESGKRPIMHPGVIGGHCVMPNIKLLKQIYNSNFLNTIEESNNQKIKSVLKAGKDLEQEKEKFRK